MRLSRLEKARYAAAESKAPKKPEHVDLEGLASKIVGGPLLPTQREYIFAPERICWYTGPWGVAKTSSLVASIVIPALLYPGTTWLIARATWWSLEETTLKRFLQCMARFPGIILDKQTGPPARYWLASAMMDEHGEPCEPSQIIFHGLDDLEKLGGTEFTGVGIDEASELDEPMVATLNGRLREKKLHEERPEGPFFLRMVSNPVRRSHWLHRKFCNEQDCDPEPWGRKFRPRPNENDHNLPPGYHEEQARGLSPEMRLRFIEGECGPDPSGQPVFPEFRHSLHVGDLGKPQPGQMIRGWDFGRRRPAVVWAQAHAGKVNRYACDLGENKHLEVYTRHILEKSSLLFPHATSWIDFVDSHGTQLKDTSDKTSIDILRSFGLRPRYRDVGIDTGLSLMSKGLCTLVDGRPRSMYDRVGCSLLIEGYAGGYSYDMPRPGHAAKEKPVADGFYEHLMDADRYIEVGLQLGSTSPMESHRRVLRKIRNRETGY